MEYEKLVGEFARLLREKNRKEINKWKEQNHLIIECGFHGESERVTTDLETIEYLLRSSFATSYITYKDDEDWECVFKNSKSKNRFIDDFC